MVLLLVLVDKLRAMGVRLMNCVVMCFQLLGGLPYYLLSVV